MNSLFPQKTLVCSSFECLDINIRAPFGSDILHCVPGKKYNEDNIISSLLLSEEAVEDQHQEHYTSLNIVNCHSLRFYEECNIILLLLILLI